MKKVWFLIIIISLILSCKKNDVPSLIGKWYCVSKDTKLEKAGCALKDTTIFYTRSTTLPILEFKSDGILVISYPSNSNTISGTYKYENDILEVVENGNITKSEVSNVNIDGWRMLQKNYVWCPTKTVFNEYLNYKKY